jgi:hypothetical protein
MRLCIIDSPLPDSFKKTKKKVMPMWQQERMHFLFSVSSNAVELQKQQEEMMG